MILTFIVPALFVCSSALIGTSSAQASQASSNKLEKRYTTQKTKLHKSLTAVKFWRTHKKLYAAHWKFASHDSYFHRKRIVWLKREMSETIRSLVAIKKAHQTQSLDYWINRQIAIATKIGSESGGDPWPNCPDPFDGGGSWQATVNCENNGNWYDSPGYFRCGLQFDPGWENKYGRLCP